MEADAMRLFMRSPQAPVEVARPLKSVEVRRGAKLLAGFISGFFIKPSKQQKFDIGDSSKLQNTPLEYPQQSEREGWPSG